MPHYFAFGSNLSESQMMKRCPQSRLVGPADLPDHRLTFVGASKNWTGGVAEILPAPGSLVRGCVYELSEDDLLRLDRFEGTYRRFSTEVLASSQSLSVWCYRRRPDQDTSFNLPSLEYVSIIAHAYGRFGYDLSSLLSALRF